jgi:hypothetical protein
MMALNDMVDLTDTGIEYLLEAYAINDSGQILASSGSICCLLTPLPVTGDKGHLTALSTRAQAGRGDQTCITGFVVSGGARSVLLRTIGPSMTLVPDAMRAADPALDLYVGQTRVDTNNDWGSNANAAELVPLMANLGLPSLDAGSKDAVMLKAFTDGSYTVHSIDPSGASGIVLAEIYDASSGGDGQLTACAARVRVGKGDAVGIIGFIVDGDGPATVILRAVGPGLLAQGVSDVLQDPKLWLYNGSQPVMGNDNWGKAANMPLLSGTMKRIGAFDLADGSKDAALIIQLEPGHYSMVVEGADGGQGVALMEVYLVPSMQ